jgi:hypothetical protein
MLADLFQSTMIVSIMLSGISIVAIQAYVGKRRKDIPSFFFQLNALILYPELTKKENGKIGRWFYLFIIGFVGMMTSAIVTIIIAVHK